MKDRLEMPSFFFALHTIIRSRCDLHAVELYGLISLLLCKLSIFILCSFFQFFLSSELLLKFSKSLCSAVQTMLFFHTVSVFFCKTLNYEVLRCFFGSLTVKLSSYDMKSLTLCFFSRKTTISPNISTVCFFSFLLLL